ncbi:hypothetical protein EXU57_21880 [Segetibacter sp. 3557_3]|uniref:hypothetical protein n=1 Tax=Segetibacter sp. 3557_3 TaxID=2547429 RepID=UPI0010587B52|nr:hypothetical protein [Segetibacter sp. 3557_3]TDH20084.1 hypothetical protein EXU57_21880 [Segetibacter sp. 3557_3]
MIGSIKKFTSILVIAAVVLAGSTGCKKFIGLERQTDWEFTPVTLDPNVKMSAWDYLKSRALGSVPADTVFKRMYQGIIYSGIDTNEYNKPNRTFIFLHNDAVRRVVSNLVQPDSYFGYYRVGSPLRPANSWEEYPQDSVKMWLSYLIVDGVYNFDNLTPVNVEVPTLMKKGINPRNPESVINLRVENSGNYPIRINDFVGTLRATTVRSGGYVTTNGAMHVVDRIVEYNRAP